MRFLESASDDDLNILSSIAERIHLRGDFPALKEWLNNVMQVEGQEVGWRIYNLLGVMDLAGLKFE